MTEKKPGFINTVNDASIKREFRDGKEVTKTSEEAKPKKKEKKEVTNDADKT